MAQKLDNLKVAILVADGFEQVEMTEPKKALEQAGAQPKIVSPEEALTQKGKVMGVNHFKPGDAFPVDIPLAKARPEEFDALLLPGGLYNPDQLRMTPEAVRFVKHFIEEGKPVAAICHGPWLLVEADAVRGKRVTSWPAIKTDLINAGANWEDSATVVDGNLLTSRKPDDIPAFNDKLLSLFSQRQPALSRR